MPGIELRWPNKERVLYRVPQRREEGVKPLYYGDPGTPTWPDHRPPLRLSTHGDPDPNRHKQDASRPQDGQPKAIRIVGACTGKRSADG